MRYIAHKLAALPSDNGQLKSAMTHHYSLSLQDSISKTFRTMWDGSQGKTKQNTMSLFSVFLTYSKNKVNSKRGYAAEAWLSF